MMRFSDDIDEEIRLLEDRIRPLNFQLSKLQLELRAAKSREWIAANGVTLEQVQLSNGDGLPWFGHVQQFAKWLEETKCNKRWCEWNHSIYSTFEVIAFGGLTRAMCDSAHGELQHVPKGKS